MIIRLLNKVESIQPFTELQAWQFFKIAALSEAFGWTLLIGGLLIRHYGLPGHKVAVLIAGQIHGMIFLAYFGILIVVYSSLRWSRQKFLVAVLAGVPPYGSLVFEQWAAHRRQAEFRRVLFRNMLLAIIADNQLS